MEVVGLIAEYNPFHNGHALHMDKAKRVTGCQHCVVVMSGNFVQRGEPAIVDKACRAEMALRYGADVVIELPVSYATASAEFFARGAVKLLHATGIVTDICFGSECGELAPLQALADTLALEENSFRQSLKSELGKGLSFPAARSLALARSTVENSPAFTDIFTDIIKSPNNILAVCYLKALAQLPCGIKAHSIKREAAPYHETRLTPGISSATAIRRAIEEGRAGSLSGVMPGHCHALLERQLRLCGAARLNNLSHLFHYIINTHDGQWLKNIQDVTEGLENRILKITGSEYYIDHIITQIKTKRYTFTKIKRILLHCLLSMTQDEFHSFEKRGGPQYIRVLGFRKSKAFLLGEIQSRARLPLLMNLKHAPGALNAAGMAMLAREIESTDVYCLSTDGCANRPLPRHVEYTQPIVIV